MTIKLKDIEIAVAQMFRVHPSDLHVETHARKSVRPRQVAMYLADQLTDYSKQRIANYFGKSRWACINGIETITKMVSEQPKFAETIDSIRVYLLSNKPDQSDVKEAA